MELVGYSFEEYYWFVGLSQLAASVLLFFIINWFGARTVSIGYMQVGTLIKEETAPAFNFIFRVVAPIVYFIIVCAIAQQLGFYSFLNNSYLIVVYYWLFRLFWIFSAHRWALTSWGQQILYLSCSIALAIWVYSLMEKAEKILPNPQNLIDNLWLLIILFIYSVLNKTQDLREKTIKRMDRYYIRQYSNFHQKYNKIIKEFFHDDFYEALTYAIMIYEDFNRPRIVRYLEYVSFFILRRPHTLGIMQVKTAKCINNVQSIKLAMRKIKIDAKEIDRGQYYTNKEIATEIADRYNGGDNSYAEVVTQIFELIATKFYDIPYENAEYQASK